MAKTLQPASKVKAEILQHQTTRKTTFKQVKRSGSITIDAGESKRPNTKFTTGKNQITTISKHAEKIEDTYTEDVVVNKMKKF